MKFELDFFEEFIQRELKAKRAGNSIVPDFARKTKEISNEVERIKKGLRTQLFSVENESRFELLIQHHQTHIITLADRVLKFIDRKEAEQIEDISRDQTKLNLCKILYKSFRELLTYIENYFSKYFNQDSNIPVCYAIISIKEIREKLEAINTLSSQKKLDPSLLEIVLYPVIDFTHDPEKTNITFRRLIYIKQLVKDLLSVLTKDAPVDFTQEVCRLLYYINFNSYYFLTYVTEKISREVQELPSVADQLDRLSFFLKGLNQLQVKPGFSLKPNRPSIQGQVSTWLEEEIHYTERKRQLTLMMPPGNYPDALSQDFKIKTILSVSQLAFYIRLLIEAGVITNKNQVELIRFFSKHFSSLKNENVSSESLRRKYYNIEQTTITSIQEILHRLIDHSKKMI
jgi:hypothetical protein